MNDKDGHGLKFDKVRPTFSCYNCKNYQLWLVLPDVICLNLLHNSTRVFFVRIKALCNDFRTELAWKSNIPFNKASLSTTYTHLKSTASNEAEFYCQKKRANCHHSSGRRLLLLFVSVPRCQFSSTSTSFLRLNVPPNAQQPQDNCWWNI